MTPTARTLAECKRRGWQAQVVERFNPHARIRQDLFGCIDVIACVPPDDAFHGEILGIQATSGANHASRLKKAAQEPKLAAWRAAGGRFAVWSWRRGADRKWKLREEVI